jgi:hypothetical protein
MKQMSVYELFQITHQMGLDPSKLTSNQLIDSIVRHRTSTQLQERSFEPLSNDMVVSQEFDVHQISVDKVEPGIQNTKLQQIDTNLNSDSI